MENTFKYLMAQHPIMLDAISKELTTYLDSEDTKKRQTAEVLIILIAVVFKLKLKERGLK